MKWAARGIALLMIVYLSAIWVAGYDREELDDKAVHYYSAARLYSDRAHAQAIAAARPGWLGRLEGRDKYILANRLSCFANYTIPSSLSRLIMQIEAPTEGLPPCSYTRPVKIAFFLLYLFGLAWIAAICWPGPLMSVFLFTCLVAASFTKLPLAWITPIPPSDMVYFHFVPRGSAILLLAGAFAAFQKRRLLPAGISCLLIFGWHFGFALAVVPLALLAFGLTAAAQIWPMRARIIIAAALLLAGGLVTAAATGPLLILRLWIPLSIICLLIIAGGALLQNSWLNAALLAGAYLFFAQTAIIIFADPRVLGWSLAVTGNLIVAEYSFRLLGSTHVAATALLAAAGVGILAIAFRRMSKLRQEGALLSAAFVLLAFAACANLGMIKMAADGRCAFFWPEDAFVRRLQLGPGDLCKLDPANHASFYASLGDFLLRPVGGAAGVRGGK